MIEFKLFEAIAAGGDVATIAIAFGFYKLSSRITVVETAITYIKASVASLKVDKH
jgi:hypothetical protein